MVSSDPMMFGPKFIAGLVTILLCRLSASPSTDEALPTVWIQQEGHRAPLPLDELQWNGKIFTGSVNGDLPTLLPTKVVHHLWFPPSDQDSLGHRPAITLKLREPIRIPYRSLPDAMEIRFRLPSEPGLYLLPLVDQDGVPLRNTFQLWIGEKSVTAKGKGFGRNEVTAMAPWTRKIPESDNGEVLVQLLIDRKEELCFLRLNHVLVQSWKIPTSYLAKAEGNVFLELRSGIDPQKILDLHLSRWPSGRPGNVNLHPEKGQDRIWLRNGDLLPGEALRIEDRNVWVRLEDGLTLPIPFARIREIHFAK